MGVFFIFFNFIGLAVAFLFSQFKLTHFLVFDIFFFKVLGAVFFLWFLNSFLVFLLVIKKKESILVYVLISLFFSVFGLNFLLRRDWVLSFFLFGFYLGNFFYLFIKTGNRLVIFRKFKVNEIFIPSIKGSFIILTSLVIVLSFFQARSFVKQGKPVFSPPSFLRLVRPVVPLINKQLSLQIEDAFNKNVGGKIGIEKRDEAIRFILSEVLETMSEGKVRQLLGFRPDVLPVDKIKVYNTGEIDIEPALVAASPKIVKKINNNLVKHRGRLAFLIPVLMAVVLLPFLWFFNLVSYIVLPLLFYIFIRLSFLTKKVEMREVELVE